MIQVGYIVFIKFGTFSMTLVSKQVLANWFANANISTQHQRKFAPAHSHSALCFFLICFFYLINN